MGLRPIGAPASVTVEEDIPHGTPSELHLFTVRSSDPDVLVIIADRHGLPGRGPRRPFGDDTRQVILRFILPVHNPNPLITRQDLIIHREAIIIVARSEDAIGAKKFRVIEQLRLNLLAVGCHSERAWRGQQDGHVN
jgi:hypothetical protein